MGGTGCSTGQILGVFAFHLPPWNGFVPRMWNTMFYHFKTNIPHVFFKNYTFVPSRPVPSRLRTKRTLMAPSMGYLVIIRRRPHTCKACSPAPEGNSILESNSLVGANC
ncbi:hypothetical protein ACFX13_009916 [Malus domestica]